MSRLTIFAIFCVFASVVLAAKTKYPIYEALKESVDENGQIFVGPIRKCPVRTTDSDIDDCVVKMLEDLQPRIGKGIPEIGFVGVDPFRMSKYDYQGKFGPIRVNLAIKDIQIDGLSQYKNLKLNFDTKNRNMTFLYEVPNILIGAQYKAGGTAVLFPITGAGPAFVQVGNVKVAGHMDYSVVKREDKVSVAQIDKTVIEKMTIGGMNVRIRGLFNGNPIMSSLVHYFANNYGAQLFDAFLKDDLSSGIAEIVTQDFVNPFLYNLPHLVQYIEDE